MLSVVIPCIPKHFWNIQNIIDEFKKGIRYPDEIIVSLSDSQLIDPYTINTLEDNDNVTVVSLFHSASSAMNRQNGSNHVTGDLIVYQDADDLPHPRRLEIIEWFFNMSDIVHLNHSYYRMGPQFFGYPYHREEIPSIADIRCIKSEDIYNKYFPTGSYKECIDIASCYGGNLGFIDSNNNEIPIHTGAVAIRREVLNKVKWREASEMELVQNYRYEDYEFCLEVLYKFNKSMIIDAPLYQYT